MARKNRSKIRDPKLIVYDFDGVLTDNRIILREDGLESVIVNRADGLAIAMLKSLGVRQIILSTEENRVVKVRAAKLGIPSIQGIKRKRDALVGYCDREGIRMEDVVYLGNDLNDLDVMKDVGHPVSPADACDEVKAVSTIVLRVPGGYGVVRSLLDYLVLPGLG